MGASCAVDERSFDKGGPDAGDILENLPNPDGLALGAFCTDGAACSTGLCVDGVCCESACDAPCAQCSSEGRCDVVPEDDPVCPEIVCPASDQCELFMPTLSSGRCLALGQCRMECEGQPVGEGQLCSLSKQTFETRCDGDGNCVDSRVASGGACQVDGECASGSCVDGVCCAEACDGVCEVCSAAGGSCVAVDPSSPDNVCGEDGRVCAGRGECALPLGRECASGAECASAQCVQALVGASTLCCEEACPGDQRCSSAGRCVAPVADLGQACQGPGDCTLGQCIDGVCCDTPCDGVCERCNAPGEAGRCVADAPETACDTSEPERRCLSRGLCQLPNGEVCEGNADCGSGRCEPALAGGRICCAVTCQAGQACDATGGACQVAPRGNGDACQGNGECISGSCQDGRCCPSDCGGACEVCSARGVCEIPPAGAAGCAAVDCASQNTDCRTFGSIGNLCEGVGDCKELADCPFTNVGQGTSCTLATGGTGRCNGSGACEPPPQSEICGNVPLPARVRALAPVRGAYTGSLRAPAARQTLRPLLVWSASSTTCPAGPVSYQVQLDNSCQPGALAACAFPSPELDTTSAQAQLRPTADLPVQSQPPVGAFYAWRVRACDPAARCSEWSDVAYLHVGRTPHDLNGDGFADLLAGNPTADLHLGGAQFDSRAEQQVALSEFNLGQNVRFVGDLNGDGFADISLLENDFDVCGSSGLYPVALFGRADLSSLLQKQVFCAVAGSPSVLFQIGNVGDLNGDGFDDLAFARELSGQTDAFRVLLGGTTVSSTAELDLDISIPAETGTSTAPYPHTATSPQSFDGAGDFNADGFADVVLAGDGRRSAGMFRLRALLGGATFSRSFLGSADISGCSNPYVARIGDVTADGRDDWGLVCNLPAGGSRFGVVRGGDTLSSTLSDGFDSAVSLRALSRGIDLDSDGTLDVIVLRQAETAAVWRRGNFTPAAPTTLNQVRGGTLIGNADHNGDGRVDFFTWESGGSPSWVPAGASLNVTPITLVPFAGSAAPSGIVF